MTDFTISQDEVVDTLNFLLRACIDSQWNFQYAAKSVDSEDLKTLFQDYAQQRKLFVTQLTEAIAKRGGEAVNEPSASGTLHHIQMTIRAAVNDETSATVIKECNRSESMVLSVYENMMNHDLPDDVDEMVQKQYVSILSAQAYIHELQSIYQSS